MIRSLAIIVPVYNEVATSRTVIDRLLAVDLPLPREILVIDDGSTDGTGNVLDTAVGDGLPIRVVHAAKNSGTPLRTRRSLRCALRLGCSATVGDSKEPRWR